MGAIIATGIYRVMIIITIVKGPDKGTVFHLDGEESLVVGRHGSVRLKDQEISRQHAAIRFEDGQWTLTDQESRAGTVVNGKRTQGPTALRNGSLVGLGRSAFVFTVIPEAGETATTEINRHVAAEDTLPPTNHDLLTQILERLESRERDQESSSDSLPQILDRIEAISFDQRRTFEAATQNSNTTSSTILKEILNRIEALDSSLDEQRDQVVRQIDTINSEHHDQLQTIEQEKENRDGWETVASRLDAIDKGAAQRWSHVLDQIDQWRAAHQRDIESLDQKIQDSFPTDDPQLRNLLARVEQDTSAASPRAHRASRT